MYHYAVSTEALPTLTLTLSFCNIFAAKKRKRLEAETKWMCATTAERIEEGKDIVM